MNALLRRTIDVITVEHERGQGFDQSFTLVARVLEEFGGHDLANRLFDQLAEEVNWEIIAELFNILLWETEDNGRTLTETIELWLQEAQERGRVWIALNLEVYPFLKETDMQKVLATVATRMPDMAERCYELIESRKKIEHKNL